jgi:hypothetical protein
MQTAVLDSSSSFIVTDSISGISRSYLLNDTTYQLKNYGSGKVLTLYSGGQAVIKCATTGFPGFGNSIFGSTNPDVAVIAVRNALSSSGSGGGTSSVVSLTPGTTVSLSPNNVIVEPNSIIPNITVVDNIKEVNNEPTQPHSTDGSTNVSLALNGHTTAWFDVPEVFGTLYFVYYASIDNGDTWFDISDQITKYSRFNIKKRKLNVAGYTNISVLGAGIVDSTNVPVRITATSGFAGEPVYDKSLENVNATLLQTNVVTGMSGTLYIDPGYEANEYDYFYLCPAFGGGAFGGSALPGTLQIQVTTSSGQTIDGYKAYSFSADLWTSGFDWSLVLGGILIPRLPFGSSDMQILLSGGDNDSDYAIELYGFVGEFPGVLPPKYLSNVLNSTSIINYSLLDIYSSLQSIFTLTSASNNTLTSIDNKSISEQPLKTTINGLTTTTTPNANLLDITGAGAWIDVRQYQSCELTVVTVGGGVLVTTGLLGSHDSVGNNPVAIPAFIPSTGVLSTITTFPTGQTNKRKYDLSGVNYIRFGATSIIAGHTVVGVFNAGAGTATQVTAKIAGTVPASISGSVMINNQAPSFATDITAGVITSTTTSGAFGASSLSYQVNINVTAINGTNTQSIVRIQESADTGTTWRTVYTFEPITVAKGARIYRSPIFVGTGNRYRYVETVTGTSPIITRSIGRVWISGSSGLVNQDTKSTTVFNTTGAGIDVPAYGVIRAIIAQHQNVGDAWLQVHDSSTPVAANAVPKMTIRITTMQGGLVLGDSFFGSGRLLCGATDPRITISTTPNTYTSISAFATNEVQLYIEYN